MEKRIIRRATVSENCWGKWVVIAIDTREQVLVQTGEEEYWKDDLSDGSVYKTVDDGSEFDNYESALIYLGRKRIDELHVSKRREDWKFIEIQK